MIWGAYLSLLGHNNPENNSLLLDENHELEESSRKESRAIDSLEVARIAGCLSLTGLSLALVALSWPARVEMGLRSYAYVSFLIANVSENGLMQGRFVNLTKHSSTPLS